MKAGHLKVLAVSGWAAWAMLLGWGSFWASIERSNERYRTRAVQEATRRFSSPNEDGKVVPFEIIHSSGWSPAASALVKIRFRDGKEVWVEDFQFRGNELVSNYSTRAAQ